MLTHHSEFYIARNCSNLSFSHQTGGYSQQKVWPYKKQLRNAKFPAPQHTKNHGYFLKNNESKERKNAKTRWKSWNSFFCHNPQEQLSTTFGISGVRVTYSASTWMWHRTIIRFQAREWYATTFCKNQIKTFFLRGQVLLPAKTLITGEDSHAPQKWIENVLLSSLHTHFRTYSQINQISISIFLCSCRHVWRDISGTKVPVSLLAPTTSHRHTYIGTQCRPIDWSVACTETLIQLEALLVCRFFSEMSPSNTSDYLWLSGFRCRSVVHITTCT